MNYKGKKNQKRKSTNYSGRRSESVEYSDNRSKSSFYDRSQNRDRELAVSSDNDVSWYTADEHVVRDAASFPFSQIQGLPIHDAFTTDAENAVQPGIFNILLWPTIGTNTNDNSKAVNIAARNIYSWIRHANSGHANYDTPDLMKYLIAMDNIYSWYSFMRRIYGVAMVYNQRNRTYPRLLLESMNVDIDSILNNLAQLRYLINQFAVRAGSLCVPATFSYFSRHIWLYNNIYGDSVTSKAGLYIFNPAAVYYYNEAGSTPETGVNLVPIELGCLHHSPLTLGTLEYISNLLIKSVIESEDLGIMSGDILKAYGSDKLIKLPGIDENYTILPVYSQEVLSQIQNSTSQGYVKQGTANIWENMTTGALVFDPTLRTGSTTMIRNKVTEFDPYIGYDYGDNFYVRSGKLLTMPVDNPTPGDNMVATRLTNFVNRVEADPDGDGYIGHLSDSGSEFIAAYQILVNGTPGFENGKTQIHEFHTVLNANPNTAASKSALGAAMKGYFLLIDRLTKFDYHPEVRIETDSNLESACFFDLDNYTVLLENSVNRCHEVAMLNEFSIPLMGAHVESKTNV